MFDHPNSSCLHAADFKTINLDQPGFHLAAFGCATCVGNSGDLDESVSAAIIENGIYLFFYGHRMYIFSFNFVLLPISYGFIHMYVDIVAAAVLSANRNFEGRVHPLTRANYLASPPLVVAYALAGTVSTPMAFFDAHVQLISAGRADIASYVYLG